MQLRAYQNEGKLVVVVNSSSMSEQEQDNLQATKLETSIVGETQSISVYIYICLSASKQCEARSQAKTYQLHVMLAVASILKTTTILEELTVSGRV